MKVVCLFLPALLATGKELNGRENGLKKAAVYSKYCIIINLFMLLFLMIIGKSNIHFEDLCTIRYYVFYLFISFIIAELLPKILLYCRKNIKFSIKRK